MVKRKADNYAKANTESKEQHTFESFGIPS
jgi:hypothetical protein